MGIWESVVASVPAEKPILIAGPTASGKSNLAVEIASEQGGTIVNADALQVFSDWEILTARPDPKAQSAARHVLYGHVPGTDAYSVGQWLRDVRSLIDHDSRLIFVGGTGLYFAALTDGLADIPPTPDEVRAIALRRLETEGPAGLLSELDPPSRDEIDTQNPMRIQRAWEVLTATGRGIAEWRDETGPPLVPLSSAHAMVLAPDRDRLAKRIEKRFDSMIRNGLLEEVSRNAPNWSSDLPSSKAIGAADLMAHHAGEIDLATAAERVTTATRQYAKRQRSWFRSRMKEWLWIDPPGD